MNNPGQDMSTPSRDLQRQILKRFLQITTGRLARIRLDLNKDQQLFVTALPVLLHSRNSSTPCFDSEHTPCGISRYKPGAVDIQKVQRALPTLEAREERAENPDILGVYLSSNCGSLTDCSVPQLTVWLCHRDDLGLTEIGLLHRKCGSIAGWGKVLGLTVNFRIFNSQFVSQHSDQDMALFRNNDKQHHLQLDNFYHRAIQLAGKMPLWWFIPPTEEHRYKQYSSILRHKQLVNDDDVLDFGPCQQLPAAELIDYALQQMKDCDQQVYRSYLQLTYAEAQIQTGEDLQPLSRTFKSLVYQNSIDLDNLDSEVMQLQCISNYLQQDNKRLDIIHRCFYYCIGIRLADDNRSSWRHKLLVRLCEQWQWQADQLNWLDNHQWWSVKQLQDENNLFCQYFLQAYHQLNRHIEQDNALLEEFSGAARIQGRKLFARGQRQAGKINYMLPLFSQYIQSDMLHIHYQPDNALQPWSIAQGEESEQELYRSDQLLALLCWCCGNGLFEHEYSLQLHNTPIQQADVERIIEKLQKTQASALTTEQVNYEDAAQTDTILMFVNAVPHISEKPLPALASTLTTSDGKDIVINNIEAVYLNNWGELYCKRFDGNVALFNCISDYLQQVPPGDQVVLPALHFHGFGPLAEGSGIQRLQHLFRDINACYHSGLHAANSRFVLQMKNQFFIIQHQDNNTQFKGARNMESLIKRLGDKQESYSPIIFERYTLEKSILSSICAVMRPGSVQIFFIINADETATLYILDEKGSLFSYQQKARAISHVLQPLETFLQSALYRQNTSSDYHSQNQFIDMDVLYYQIHPHKEKPPVIKAVAIQDHMTAQHAFSIQAIAEPDSNNEPVFNIYCDQQEFSSVDWGSELYPSVARFILAKRKSGERYPCHISDLDLSSIHALTHERSQIVDYLRFKQEIENGINEALQRV